MHLNMSGKILVTGGTGYIGSHTTVELLKAGYEVVLVDNLSNSISRIVDQIEKVSGKRQVFYQADLCNLAEVQRIFEEHPDIKGVVHFAAYKAVGESVAQPLKYYQNNLVSLMNLLQVMGAHNVEAFVFSSSCTVYGQPATLPVTEDSPVQKAFSPYGNTKQISEEILNDTVATSALRVVSLRYFNPIGAHPSGMIGELPLGTPNNLVPIITQTAAGLRPALMVYGNDYNTPDGTCIRDYIHVVDLAVAHVVAIDRVLGHKMETPFEVFNLGTGKGTSVLEAIEAFERVSGQKLNYVIAGRREGDVEQVWADTSRANRVLGWKSTKDLDEMMASAWQWELNLKNGILNK